VNDLEKKEEHRHRFLRMLYEATGGRRFTFAVATDIRDKLGLTDDEFSSSFTVGDVPTKALLWFRSGGHAERPGQGSGALCGR
jgi:hypothetical protein